MTIQTFAIGYAIAVAICTLLYLGLFSRPKDSDGAGF